MAILPAVLIGGLALVPRLLSTGYFQTADEIIWMEHTTDFGDALLSFDPAAASASTTARATMPGVTTMWLGSAARTTRWLAARMGLIDDLEPFTTSRAGWHLAQAAVAVATSILIAIVVVLAWRWTGSIPAMTTGALLASEPFMVAHSSVLHTDALCALFGFAGLLALLLALGIPSGSVARPRATASLAGALLAGALLSKVSAPAMLPGLAVVVGAAMLHRAGWSARRGRLDTAALRGPTSLVLLACAVALATTLVAWPALWATPIRQLNLLWWSAKQARDAWTTFFLGEITGTPGPLFYFVAVPLRLTPWFFLAILICVPVALLGGRRRHALALLAVAASILAVISFAAKQADRYALPALPLAALVVGLGVDSLFATVRSAERRRLMAMAGAVAAVLMLAHAMSIAPWGLAYFDPLLGGSKVAESAILVGWGEGLELAGEKIRAREAPNCDVKLALKYWRIKSAFPCGTTVPPADGADYRVLYVNERQRMPADELRSLRERARLIDVVTVRGIDYVELYDLREPPAK